MKTHLCALQRIDIIDAFRGFALVGIVLTHMLEQYLGTMPTESIAAGMRQGPLDGVIEGLVGLLVRGKFFALFSFLFGLSFFIQMDRAAQKGVNYQGRFLWRIVLLLIIGYVHSLFYRGDILTIYAVLAFFLVPFYRASNRTLLVVSALLILGAGRYFVFALNGGQPLLPYGDMSPELSYNQAYYDALLSGSLFDVIGQNMILGHLAKLEFQINVFGRWYLTFAFFLIGLWVGRVRMFERLGEWHARLRRALWVSALLSVVFLVSAALLFGQPVEGEPMAFDSWRKMTALTAFDLFNCSLAIVLLCAFVLIYRRPAGERILSHLAPYGRMALSSYIMQSLAGTFLFYHFGLGMLGAATNTQTLGIAVVIIAFQIWLSAAWLSRFRYGLIEWLWRSGTKLKWQAMAP
ncbi:MAG: DUF418 domain-containing protein [Gammaproteobacteria bacterium]|nr:DUF418 domain-containing protein [Gammaproteobacteria bacterium]